ncbi:MAG: 50S ribosomal protein L24 [Patescibacteria group bacterium]|nr:50S ribosomal protein L24 [Patescibacteria group bacterium]
MKIKKDDKIKVLSGKDRGRTGIVKKIFPKKNKVIIAGVNLSKKHNKPRKGSPGGIVEIETPLWSGKIILICPQCGKPTRVGYQLDKNGKKYRICRKCQSLLDNRPEKSKK